MVQYLTLPQKWSGGVGTVAWYDTWMTCVFYDFLNIDWILCSSCHIIVAPNNWFVPRLILMQSWCGDHVWLHRVPPSIQMQGHNPTNGSIINKPKLGISHIEALLSSQLLETHPSTKQHHELNQIFYQADLSNQSKARTILHQRYVIAGSERAQEERQLPLLFHSSSLESFRSTQARSFVGRKRRRSGTASGEADEALYRMSSRSASRRYSL